MSEQVKPDPIKDQYDTEPAAEPIPAETPPPEKVEEAKVSPPVRPQHPRYLLNIASELGMSQADIDDCASPDELGMVVAHLQKQALRFLATNTAKAAKAEEEEELDLGTDEDGKKITLDRYDPGLQKFIKDSAKKQKALEKELAETKQAGQAVQGKDWEQKLDSLFDGMGEAYHEVFGSGPVSKLRTGSSEVDRRVAVLNYLASKGKKTGNLEDDFKHAVKHLYGDKPAKKDEAAPVLEDRKKQWEGAGLAKPTQRAGAKEVGSRKKAEMSVANALKDMGGADDSTHTELDDFI